MSNSDPNPFRLHVLGAPDLLAPDGRRITSVLSQPKRLGLLTYLALAVQPVSRASLVALFWPESDEGRARNALSQAVFHLRRSLDERVVQSAEGDRLWAPPEHLWCDAREALAASEGAQIGGELLEGWNADDSQPLQEWLDGLRRRLRAREVAAGVAPSATSSGPKPARPFMGSRITRLLGVATVAVLVGVALSLALLEDTAPEATPPLGGSLAVLSPQVLSVPGAPTIDPAALHAEILSALPHVDGMRIVSAGYAASVTDFRRQLDALGVAAEELPSWILEVSVRVTDGEARAIGLLHRAPGYELSGRTTFNVSYAGADAALLEVPQEVARGISAMVGDALALQGR